MSGIRIVALACIGVVFAWVGAYIFKEESAKWFPGLEQRGQFGDSFGAFNAIVGALGFAAVALSLYQQQKEISNAKDDQNKMLLRMEVQANAMKAQAELLSSQLELDRLSTEYEQIDRRLELRYREIPLGFEEPDSLMRLQYHEVSEIIEAAIKEAETLATTDAKASMKMRHYRSILQEILSLRQRRRSLYMKLTNQKEEEATL